MNMAQRIQTLRKTRNISQEELADKLGVSRQAVSKWESEQSTPDLDHVILMSDYFETTTDYLLKGADPIKSSEQSGEALTSKILYTASTALIAIGLLCGFANWYENQMQGDIWGAMIIQVVGIVAYFIARMISHEKPDFTVKLLNIILVLFMPISMVTALLCLRGVSPYPLDLPQTALFIVAYAIACVSTFILLRKQTKV